MMVKISQPCRNPGEFACYLAGVKAAVDALAPENYVDALAFGGGIPTELTITTKPEPVVTAEIEPEESDDAEPEAGA